MAKFDPQFVLLPYEITLFSNKAKQATKQMQFYYLMKLHYSQTGLQGIVLMLLVLLPYEITLFSNSEWSLFATCFVLLPYEITLFSNICQVFFYLIVGFTTL